MIIGITGKSGSGKTTLSNLLGNVLGFPVINVDGFCHTAIDNLCNRDSSILDQFGIRKEYEQTKIVDTKKIGNILFNNQKKYEKYLFDVWKEASRLIDIVLENTSNIIIEHILLPQTQYWNLCDRKILVTCDQNTRFERVLKRDNISLDYLTLREKASISYDSYTFDYVYKTGEEN